MGNLPSATYAKMQLLLSRTEHTDSRLRICKKRFTQKIPSFRRDDDGSGVRYPADFKSVGFRSWLEASSGYSHAEELGYNRGSWDTIVEVCLKFSRLFKVYAALRSRSLSIDCYEET